MGLILASTFLINSQNSSLDEQQREYLHTTLDDDTVITVQHQCLRKRMQLTKHWGCNCFCLIVVDNESREMSDGGIDPVQLCSG